MLRLVYVLLLGTLAHSDSVSVASLKMQMDPDASPSQHPITGLGSFAQGLTSSSTEMDLDSPPSSRHYQVAAGLNGVGRDVLTEVVTGLASCEGGKPGHAALMLRGTSRNIRNAIDKGLGYDKLPGLVNDNQVTIDFELNYNAGTRTHVRRQWYRQVKVHAGPRVTIQELVESGTDRFTEFIANENPHDRESLLPYIGVTRVWCKHRTDPWYCKKDFLETKKQDSGKTTLEYKFDTLVEVGIVADSKGKYHPKPYGGPPQENNPCIVHVEMHRLQNGL